jgi:uncharacterized protein
MRLSALLTLALLAASPLRAECVGQNLIAALPTDQRAAIEAAAATVPYPRGNLWQATRDGQQITLVGTFHLDDPRHAATLKVLTPALLAARTLLIEAGPQEEDALKSYVAEHPERLLNATGPTLPEALPEADWLRLSQALRDRGIPPFFAAKMQPWYVSTLLAIPACQFAQAAAMNGLDRRLITLAQSQGMTVAALEPFDTIFAVFDGFAQVDQMAILMQTLDASAADDDMAVTLADSYFAGESRLFWEFSKLQLQTVSGLTQAEVDREFDLVQEALIDRRNRAWIDRITTEAAKRPVLVAFGALHLSGESGVLNLLARDGWTISRLDQ